MLLILINMFKELKEIQGVDLSATPIRIYKTNVKLNKTQLKKLKNLEYIKKPAGHHISKQKYILDDCSFLADLKNKFNQIADHYTHEVLGLKDQIQLLHSWSTINNMNDRHHIHTHPNSFFTIVYYTQVESGTLNIYLHKSSIEKIYNFDYGIKEYNPYNSKNWKILPEPGDFVVLLGDVTHGTFPNKSNVAKILIATNYFIKGVQGAVDNVSDLKFDGVKNKI